MLQSYHQNAEQFEISFNKTKFDALPDKMKAIIEIAVEAASADMSWKAVDRYSKDYIELQTKDKVRFYKTPDSILQRQLEIYDAGGDKKAADNPLFKEIAESQRAFAARAVKWDLDTNVSRRMAYNHYFAKASSEAGREEELAGPCVGASHPANAGWLVRFLALPMNAQSIIRAIDQVSYWSGKIFAWLIVALTLRRLHRGLQAVHPQRPDGLDLRLQQHAVRHAVHDVRGVHAGRGRPRARRLRLPLPAAAHPGRPRPRAVSSVLRPRHPGADLRGLRLRRRLLAHRRALHRDGGRAAGLPLQVRDPDRRRARHAPGSGGDRALHRVPAHRRVARAHRGRRGDRRHRRRSSATASTSTRSHAAPPWQGAQAIDEAARHRSRRRRGRREASRRRAEA